MFPYAGDIREDKFQSRYEKESQSACPGFYTVRLSDFDVLAKMTATEHTAFHSYTFNKESIPHLMIDFQNGITFSESQFHNHVIDAVQNFESPTRISGSCRTKVWIDRTYYYVIEFNAPITGKRKLESRDSAEVAPRYVFDFDLKKGKKLMVKISLSATSIENARMNMAKENPGWDFGEIRKTANKKWNDLLSRIEIGGTDEQKNIFYTSMYHLFIHPNNIADADEKPFYSTLSLWDTYRAAHPLYTILTPEKVDGFVNSLLMQFDKQGFLPIWALWGGETYCMIGNHAVPVIVDAYLKGFRGFDAEKAYQAVKTSLTSSHLNSDWETYDKYGYYPFDSVKVESVSRTLESCYDDYCAAQFAKALGKDEDYKFFMKRAGYYRNLFDPATKLMRPKDSKGDWRVPFNSLQLSHASSSGGDYTEGNAWQYTWHVQHDIQGLIELMGGPDYFISKLDTLFNLESTISGTGFLSDVTGLIGQYAHGNEPSHHVAYLFSLAGKKWRTEELINKIVTTQYNDRVDGLCGNDDCGQMSAWYIFSAIGFYPVNPCGGEFVLGAPQIPFAQINLPGSKTFTVTAENYSKDNIYVKSVELNGKKLDRLTISYSDIINGGSLVFRMTSVK
jgi:predicted alpha-1,2-mannosidase